MELGPTACHIWFVFQDQVRDAALLDRYRQLLTERERAGEYRFHFPEDRHRYLLTRALIRTVLSLYAPIEPTEWSFGVNAYGRPEIAEGATPTIGLSFNVSHTAGLVMLGVSRHGAVGVDAEHLGRSPAVLELAAQFCSRSELTELRREPDDHRRSERLLDLWTLKEAYAKARGIGISLPLTRFNFSLRGSHGIEMSIEGSLPDHQPGNWAFWMLRPSPDHVATLCLANPGGVPCAVVVRHAVPLVLLQTVTAGITRQSD